jgi:hypothetical protein
MRDPCPVDHRDPAAVSSWLASVQTIVEELQVVAADAAAPKAHRKHSRTHLRGVLRRSFQRLRITLGAIDPSRPAGGAS